MSSPTHEDESEPATVTISAKGQATIPKAVREAVGIEPGEEVFVSVEDGRVVIEPVPTIEELHGSLAPDDRARGEVLEQVREWDREDREREEAELRALLERHGDE